MLCAFVSGNDSLARGVIIRQKGRYEGRNLRREVRKLLPQVVRKKPAPGA
jgi:hypothetical protein